MMAMKFMLRLAWLRAAVQWPNVHFSPPLSTIGPLEANNRPEAASFNQKHKKVVFHQDNAR